ncbi:MAG: DUF29 domain-containing protein [Acidobacteriota bacterium]
MASAIARCERRALLSRVAVLTAHLLKWQVQRDRRSRSWEATIRLQRREVAALLREMPSLRRFLDEGFDEMYRNAVDVAVAETALTEEDFPRACPFTLDELVDEQFLP